MGQKIDSLIKYLQTELKMNKQFCDLNDCPPTPYMEGKNKALQDALDKALIIDGRI